MKLIKLVFAITFLSVLTMSAQEKKIKFNSGTLKICSSKNFQIEGYDGKEVIIKSLHNNDVKIVGRGNGFLYKTDGNRKIATTAPNSTYTIKRGKSNNLFFSKSDQSKKEGLKRLGKSQENKEFGIYFTIEEKNGELIFKDNTRELMIFGDEKYAIKIPNSIKLKWDDANRCNKTNNNTPFVIHNSNISSLTNFNGEVEISTSLNNLKLTDVTGPVSINSIGGNVTVNFDKKLPKKLYSIYTNNGFIDITLPNLSDINVDAIGAAIYSDLNFKVLEDKELTGGQQQMKLKLKSGRVKMKLEAGYGTVYLRKKK